MRPIIGITGNITTFKNQDFESLKINYSPLGFSKAVSLAGGTPIVLPLNHESFAAEYISMVDGLLLSGGQDVSPMFYGEEPRTVIGPIAPERDLSEIALIKEAIQQKKPILGICRGLQLINVVLGGSLYQDLKEDDSITLQHVQRALPEFVTHSIQVKTDSQIARIHQNGDYVNSIHHQAIKDLGNGLNVTAWSKDNVIEAVEASNDDYNILAVQWHPETTFTKDSASLNIFKNLIDRATQAKSETLAENLS